VTVVQRLESPPGETGANGNNMGAWESKVCIGPINVDRPPGVPNRRDRPVSDRGRETTDDRGSRPRECYTQTQGGPDTAGAHPDTT